MNENDLEGTLVLEKMAEIGKIDEFFEAVDSDDFVYVKVLLRKAKIDPQVIALVLQKMRDSED